MKIHYYEFDIKWGSNGYTMFYINEKNDNDIKEWCNKFIQHDWAILNSTISFSTRILLHDNNDIMLFKLAWGKYSERKNTIN